MSDASDDSQDRTNAPVPNQIELSPSGPPTDNIPYLLPSNKNTQFPFSSDPSNQDLFFTAPAKQGSLPVDDTPLLISSINCRDEDSTSQTPSSLQSSQFTDVDLLCLQSPVKRDATAATPNIDLLLEFDDLMVSHEQPIIEFTPAAVTDLSLSAPAPLSEQNRSSKESPPDVPEQSDSGGSGESFDTPPSTPSWITDAVPDNTPSADNIPLSPTKNTNVIPAGEPATTAPVSDYVILTPPKDNTSHSSLPVFSEADSHTSPQYASLPLSSPVPTGSMLVIHGMDDSVSIEKLKLHFWLYRASILLMEVHPDPGNPALRLGVVKFCSSQLADQLQREFSQLPLCGQTHKITATTCELPAGPHTPASDRVMDSCDYADNPCSVMEGAPVTRDRKMRPTSPASRAFSPDTGRRQDPNRISRDSGARAPAKFQRIDPKPQIEGTKIHSVVITHISNSDHPNAASQIRSFVMLWWDNQVQSIVCTDDQMRPNCAIMYINTFNKSLPDTIVKNLKVKGYVFPPIEANIRLNSSWTGHLNQPTRKRPHDSSPCQDTFNTDQCFHQDVEFDMFTNSSAPPLSPPEVPPPPCDTPEEDTALLLHKVMPPVDVQSMSRYFKDFLTYTDEWEAVDLEKNFKCVRVVFSNREAAAEAKHCLEHTPFNTAYVVISIGTNAEIEQKQQQQKQQQLIKLENRCTPDDAFLIITGFDEFITAEYFEAHSIIKRYSQHYSEIRVQTNRERIMKRIRIRFHNRDAVIEAEAALLQVEFRGVGLDAMIDHIKQVESPLSPARSTVPIIVVSSIPPGVSSSDIAFLFKSFGSILQAIEIKPMGQNSVLGQCKVVFESADIAIVAVREKHGITYRGHILEVKLLSDLIQPVADPLVPCLMLNPEERRPQTLPPTPQKETFVEETMSKELFLFFTEKYKTEIDRFKQLGQLIHSENTLALKHADATVLEQFVNTCVKEISESDEKLSEEDLKLLLGSGQETPPNTNIEKIVGQFRETGHIDYIVGHFPSSIHVFGHRRSVEVAIKNILMFLFSQLEIKCSPLNLFFTKFPQTLFSDPTKFELKEMKIRINSQSLDECRQIRKCIDGVIDSCCSFEIKMTQKFLKPAHIFITRNGIQVSLLIKTPEGEYLDQASKSIEGAVVCLCGIKEHVDPLIQVLENPCEETMTISQNALQKLTRKRDKGSILLEKFEAKSKVCIRLEKKNNAVVISGFILEDVKAMVEELRKKLEDVKVTIPDSCLKKIQIIYLISGQSRDPNVIAEIIQDLEVQFQLKVEFQNQNILLSGDQESILSLESNIQELEKFFSTRIPLRIFHKVVVEANGQQFAGLIFAYLDNLSKQDTFFIFEVIRPKPMPNRIGTSDIQIIATAHSPAMVSIEQKIKAIRPRSETVKATADDFHLFISAGDKFEIIKKNEFVDILANSKCNSLEFLSIGVCLKTAQELFSSGISDQEDRRNITITAPLALYIRKKGIINQLTSQFACNLKLEDRGNSFTCCIQLDGKRDAIEKVLEHINTLKNAVSCKPFELKYPSKKFFNQFQSEVIVVKDVIQEKFKVIIDARKLSLRGDSDKDCEITIISESTPDVDQAIFQLKDFLTFEKSPHPLTPLQHSKLVEDMLPILTKQSCAQHYYIDLTRDNLVIMALKYFAKEAIPCGVFNLQPYIKFSSSFYSVPNLPIFHTMTTAHSVQRIDAIGKNNSVKIIPPQTITEPYKLEGNHDNVSAAYNEIEKFVQELTQCFGTCKIPVNCPIEALKADNEISTFLNSLSHPDTSILVTLSQQDSKLMGQQLIASYEIPLSTHSIILEIWKGDITKLKVDAIVNAANDRLSHGAGVALAISNAGGPTVQQTSDQFIRQNGPLPVSGNVILPPGNIKCQSIIHAVGPVWNEMKAEQVKNELGHCVFNICSAANSASYSSIALPAISAGIFGFPLQLSTSIIIEAIHRFFTSQQFSSVKQLILIDILDNTLQQFKVMCDSCFKPIAPTASLQPKIIPAKAPLPQTPQTPQTPQIYFQWCENDGTWKPYSDSTMQTLRQAYTSNPKGTARISRSKYTYTVDFSSMTQSNDQTSVLRNIRLVNSSASAGDDVDSLEPVPLLQPPSFWKDIGTETVVLYGRKDLLDQVRERFENLVKQLMKKTEFDVRHVSRNDLIPIMSACKASFVKLALDDHTSGSLKVKVEGFYKDVRSTETEIRANLMKLMQEQTPNLEGPPKHWEQHAADEICKLVLLQPPLPEYSEVINKFRSTMPKASLLKVERVQNTWLWTRYQQDKHRIVQKSATGANEMIVYHGTSVNMPVHIYKGEQGFEARLATSGMWGTASYFAVNASYSDTYAYQDPNGNKQIFSVKICAGDVIEMPPDKKLRLPPLKSDTTQSPLNLAQPGSLQPQLPTHSLNQLLTASPVSLPAQASGPTIQAASQFSNERYDTVSGQTGGSKVYMIYENGRAYPEYLITYR